MMDSLENALEQAQTEETKVEEVVNEATSEVENVPAEEPQKEETATQEPTVEAPAEVEEPVVSASEQFVQEHPKVFVAGSSWPPDEEIFIRYFKEHPGWKLIIAPHVIDEEHLRQIEKQLEGLKGIRYSQAEQDADCSAASTAMPLYVTLEAALVSASTTPSRQLSGASPSFSVQRIRSSRKPRVSRLVVEASRYATMIPSHGLSTFSPPMKPSSMKQDSRLVTMWQVSQELHNRYCQT